MSAPVRPRARGRTLARTALRMLALAGLAAGGARPAAAQRADSLAAGVRVRVHLLNPPPPSVVGAFVRWDSAGLTLAGPGRGGASRVIRAGDIARVERSAGTRSAGAAAGRGALRGALLGLALGTVTTGAALIAEQQDPCNSCFVSLPAVVGGLSVGFPVISTSVGAVVGYNRRERWAEVRLP